MAAGRFRHAPHRPEDRGRQPDDVPENSLDVADWYEASFRARDASPTSDMATSICPYAAKEDFMRFVDTDPDGKAD